MSRSWRAPLPSSAIGRHHRDLHVVINARIKVDRSVNVSRELLSWIRRVPRATATRFTPTTSIVSLTALALRPLLRLVTVISSCLLCHLILERLFEHRELVSCV